MDEKRMPGGIRPQTEAGGGRTFTVAASERDGAARVVVPVVGIGASAGGLEVFKLLLADLPADTGLAIVFIQHLDPYHHSMLAEILARATAMPVSEAADGMPVEANHVYVIPANFDLTIAHGALDQGARPAGGLANAPMGSEVILLVEDEDMVRVLARKILEASGYVVYEARNGREGLAFCEVHQGPIDLLMSDVVMPELGGRELVEGALKLRPGLKVLFVSGHTQDVVLTEGVRKGTAFLQKPFTPVGLAQKVRETLDANARAAGQP